MHAASLTSPRLTRVLAVLADGRPHTTREIVRKAGVMAVNACVSEPRHHGALIECRSEIIGGHRRFFYTMTKGPLQ
ncbi:hypothetical protein JI664_22225 [Rhodobacter sp. NTK016B]|nr:hypothetical protein [Rhodobacter sp. NTK016B]